MAITVATDLLAAQSSRDLSINCGTLATGDIIVAMAATEDATDTMNAPTATGVTFTQRVVDSTASHDWVGVWTGIVTSGGAKTVSITRSVSLFFHNGVCVMFPTADGYSLAGTPNTVDTRGSGGPSASITSSANNYIVAVNGDWAAVDGASRTYRGTVTEDAYMLGTGTTSTHYFWHQLASASSTTIGLSLPVGQTYTVAGVEVLASGGPPPAPPDVVMAPIIVSSSY